ncbi:hypothetical protein G5V57_02620 [Nordella sp. HKS 07]|uniref:hypothetical protein n=1 Tax=Nordella sp. HKS 07 TaxID=2712222 RepID=UPI0013E10E74|nr:hypothetical protein [Nordella sp. HKS 07]QIG46745.1 hypothetical protein G5V57_02620 [Nordella sp. HKS 07]
MTMKVFSGALCLTCLLTTVALADQKSADACAAGLSPQAKQIYETTVASHPTPGTGRGIVVATVEKMVAEGKLSRAEGRAAGEAAGACLKMLE